MSDKKKSKVHPCAMCDKPATRKVVLLVREVINAGAEFRCIDLKREVWLCAEHAAFATKEG
jgi:hypothetical protein